MGAYAGAVGSFLLFFSNFLSILLVASIVFWYFGMTGIFIAYAAANIVTGLLALIWAERVVHAQCRSQLA